MWCMDRGLFLPCEIGQFILASKAASPCCGWWAMINFADGVPSLATDCTMHSVRFALAFALAT